MTNLFLEACEKNNLDVVKDIFNHHENDWNHGFYLAASYDNLDVVFWIWENSESKIDIQLQDLWMIASKNGSQELMQWLMTNFLEKNITHLDDSTFTNTVESGSVDSVLFLWDYMNICNTTLIKCFNIAINKNDLDMAWLLWNFKDIEINLDATTVSKIFQENNFDAISFLWNITKKIDNLFKNNIYLVFQNNSIYILDWLWKNNIFSDVTENDIKKYLEIIFQNNHYESLIWLSRKKNLKNIIKDNDILKTLAKTNLNLFTCFWDYLLNDMNVIEKLFYYAGCAGKLDTLKWISQKVNIKLDVRDLFENAVSRGDISMADWLNDYVS